MIPAKARLGRDTGVRPDAEPRPVTRRRLVAALVVAALVGAAALFASRSQQSSDAPVAGAPAVLTWAPPPLVTPTTVNVSAQQRSLKLNDLQDYRVVLPSDGTELAGGVTISGGRNVVVIGGTIKVPSRAQQPDSKARRGLYLKGQTGTVHVEGVRLTGELSDAINLDERKGAVVQLQNIQVDLVYGSREGHHADVIQTWAGPRELRIDGLRAATQYQGLFLLPTQQWSQGRDPDLVEVRRSMITMLPGSSYALWLPEADPQWWQGDGLTVRQAATADRTTLVWPHGSAPARMIPSTQSIQFPGGIPGTGYRSPGYAATTQEPGAAR